MADSDEFMRGRTAGEIDERLAGHDKHFAAINGNLADLIREMHLLTLAVQRLGDGAVANEKTVITTAAALKDANDARRDSADSSWSPWQKGIAVLGAIATVVGLIYLLRS